MDKSTVSSRTRFWMFLLAMSLFLGASEGRVVHAMLPQCSDLCGPDTPCTDRCLDGSTQTQCDVYNGGECVSCGDVCGPTASCSLECLNGTPETCGIYGDCSGS